MRNDWRSAQALRIPILRYCEMMPLFCFFKQMTVETLMKFLSLMTFVVSSGAPLVSIETMTKSLVRQTPNWRTLPVTSCCSY